MAEEERTDKKNEKAAPEAAKPVKADIPKDKKADEAVKAQEDTEKGRRPGMTKGNRRPPRKDRYEEEEWVPKTKLGMLVHEGKITNMHDALNYGLPLREPQIVDTIMGEDLVDEVLKVNMVQRMTDSGRRTRFSITVVVGNGNGYVGLGSARGKEVGPTIKKAIDNAKIHMMELTRGCGSWECGCRTPHSLPYKVEGKAGSTLITLMPAPRGVGLAVGDVAKKILKLAGISDAWGFSRGQTKTTVNNAKSVMDALMGTTLMRVQKSQMMELKHHTGPISSAEPITDQGGEME